jgi:nitroreductase
MDPNVTARPDHSANAEPMHPIRAIYERRAVRGYAPDPVSDYAIRALLDAAVHVSTAVHEEPWRFVIVQGRDLPLEIPLST